MRPLLLTLFIILTISPAYAKEFYSLLERSERIIILDEQQIYPLYAKVGISDTTNRIIKNSELVTFGGNILIPNVDYYLNYSNGKIKFIKKLIIGSSVKISYKIYPAKLLLSYYQYENLGKSGEGKQKKILSRKLSNQPDGLSSSELMITGSKSFAISLGNNQDLQLDQSLFLQIDGKLSKTISVQARLSDNNSPISAEGSSKKISDLDKMFIKVYSKDYSLSFGDFFIRNQDTYFANYDYKLEGVEFESNIRYKPCVAAAISSGDHKNYTFYGTEGIQGPYYLPGKNSSRVKILSGTEKIYLNGQILSRGNDYVINYNEGAINFKIKHVITAESYIIADYEYTAEEFKSNIYFVSGEFPLWNEKSKIFMSVFSNNDDKNNPLNFTLSEQDKEILSSAGDNPLLARKTGVDSVTTGNGNYIKVDSHYEYVGYDSTGNFVVNFSYVGAGQGSYIKSGYYSYEFIGEGNGDYIPEIQLPFSQSKTNYDFGAKLSYGKFFLLSEGMISHFDRNSFSSLDKNDDYGYATNNNLSYVRKIFKKFQTKSSVFFRYTSKFFHPTARVESAETEYETTGFESSRDTISVIRLGGDFRLNYKKFLQNYISFYKEDIGKTTDQTKILNNFSFKQNEKASYIPSFAYDYFRIKQESKTDSTEIVQAVNNVSADYNYKWLNFKTGFYHKKYEYSTSLKFGLRQQRINLQSAFDFSRIKMSLEYIQDEIDSLQVNWQKFKKASQIKTNFGYFLENFSANLEYSHRENKYFNGMSNSKFDLLNTRVSAKFLNEGIYNRINYKIGNEEMYPKVKELIYVGDGNGSYTYVDSVVVYEGYGEGDYEYEITTVGNPKPIADVQFNWKMSFNPSRIEKLKKIPVLSFLQNITFTSDFGIQEKSECPRKLDVYLLKNNVLMNENYTQYGSRRLKEEFWYNIIKNKIVARLQYENIKKMDNRYENVFDESWQDKYDFGLNFYNLKKWNFENTFSFTDKTSNYTTDDFLKTDDYLIETDVSYKFHYNLIFSNIFGYEFENGEKIDHTEKYKIKSLICEPRVVYNIGSKYHLMAQYRIQDNKRSGSDYLSNILFSKRNGVSTRLNLQFNYKISKYFTGFMSYNSENYPETQPRRELKMEVRADF
ncbi:MAG: hypothetical protein U9P79_00150 [Candidatus Cloacimonadota bacterium]|nr:hypothetical protein [Candidatus Cloacimonadota bacterium]